MTSRVTAPSGDRARLGAFGVASLHNEAVTVPCEASWWSRMDPPCSSRLVGDKSGLGTGSV